MRMRHRVCARLVCVLLFAAASGASCPRTFRACLADRAGSTFAEAWYGERRSAAMMKAERHASVGAVCNQSSWQSVASCLESCPLQLRTVLPPSKEGGQAAPLSLCAADNAFDNAGKLSRIDEAHPLNGKELPIVAAGSPGTDRLLACDRGDFRHDENFNGSIVLARRGKCDATVKQETLRLLGAGMVLMLDDRDALSDLEMLLADPLAGRQVRPDAPPLMALARAGGDHLVRVLEQGTALKGKVGLGCEDEERGRDEYFDSCGIAEPFVNSLLGCADAERDENKMCARCPLSANITAPHPLQLCLRNNYLLPFLLRNVMHHPKDTSDVAKLEKDLAYIALTGTTGCNLEDYTEFKGMVVIVPVLPRCHWYTAVQLAQQAGVSAFWGLVAEAWTHTPVLQGPSGLITIPVHTVDRDNTIALVEFMKSHGEVSGSTAFPKAWVIRSSVLALHLDPFPLVNETTPAPAPPEEGQESEAVPGFEWTPTALACLVLMVLTLVLIVVFLAGHMQSQRSSLKESFKSVRLATDETPADDKADSPKKDRCTVSLGLASSILSLTLLSTVGSLAFVLAMQAGRQSTDAAAENGQDAVQKIATDATQNVNAVSNLWMETMLEATTDVVWKFMTEPVGTVEAMAFLFSQYDDTWESFARLEPSHIALAASSKWQFTLRTQNHFYTRLYLTEDGSAFTYHRTDVHNTSDLLSAAGSYPASESWDVYPVSQYRVDRTTGELVFHAVNNGWYPFATVGLSFCDAFVSTDHLLSSKQFLWRTSQLNVVLPATSSLRNPITLLVPAFNASRHRVAVVEASRDIAELDRAIHTVITAVQHAANTTIFLVDDEGVIMSSSAGTDLTVARIYDQSWHPVISSYDVTNTYAPEVNAFGAYAQNCSFGVSSVPVEAAALDAAELAAKYPRHSGEFDQKDYYTAASWTVFRFSFQNDTGAHPDAVSQDSDTYFVRDTGGNRYIAEVRGQLRAGCMSHQACRPTVSDPVPEGTAHNEVVQLTGDTVVLVYVNLTTRTPLVARTKVETSDGSWQSSMMLFNNSHTAADGTELLLYAGQENRTVKPVLHASIVESPFTVSMWFYQDNATRTDPRPRLFADAHGGGAVVQLFANATLRVGGEFLGCETRALSWEEQEQMAGQWHHITASVNTLSVQQCAVYINGELLDAQPLSTLYLASPPVPQGSPYVFGEGLRGYLDEIAVFNNSVSPAGAEGLYNVTRDARTDPAKLVSGAGYMSAEEAAEANSRSICNTTQSVPSRRWIFSAQRLAIRGEPNLVFTTAVLVPKEDILRDMTADNERTQKGLDIRRQRAEQRFVQELGFAGLVVSLVACLCVFFFIVFNDTLTRPVGKLAHLLVQIAAMKLPEPGATSYSSFIGELEIMHQAITLVVGNLRIYKSYMPLSLRLEEDDESLHSTRRARLPPLPPRPAVTPGGPGHVAQGDSLETPRADGDEVQTDEPSPPPSAGDMSLSLSGSMSRPPQPPPPTPPPVGNPLTERVIAAVASSMLDLNASPTDKEQYYRASRRAESVASCESLSSHSSTGTSATLSLHPSASGSARRPTARAHARGGLALVRRKVTFCIVNIKGFHDRMTRLSGPRVVSLHGAFLESALNIFTATKGVAEAFSGDRFMASYNAVTFNASHKASAAAAAATIHQKCPDLDVRISCSVTSGEARVGNVGVAAMKRFAYFSPVLTWGYALERYANSIDAAVLVDSWVAHDTQSQFAYRITTDIRFAKRDRRRPIRVAELLRALPNSHRHEWLFEQHSLLGQSSQGDSHPAHLKWNLWASSVLDGSWDVAECAHDELAEADKAGDTYYMIYQAMQKRAYSPQQMYYH